MAARAEASAAGTRAARRPRPPRLAVAFAALLLGLAASAAGFAVYLPHAILTGVRAVDVVGTLVGISGLVLIVMAFRVAFHGRRTRTKLLAIPLCLILAQFFVVPVVGGGLAVNTTHPHIPRASSLGLAGARDVTFAASDGVRLAAWYVPGSNGAAVILLHGSHGTRASTEDHLRMLSHAGYAVLAFDARGHGDSGGQTNALGWSGNADVAGAVAFLSRQPAVDRGRIGMLGLSMGGEVALRAAAAGVRLDAVVADGAEGGTLGDERATGLGPLATSVEWLGMRSVELFSGDDEPTPLVDQAEGIRVPVLLVASDRERQIDTIFQRRIGPRAQLWYVSDAGHTRALDEHPAAYAARVTGFLGRALR